MIIERNGEKITLTEEELSAAYREKELDFLNEDLERQLYCFAGCTDDDEYQDYMNNRNEFYEKYSLDICSLVDLKAEPFTSLRSKMLSEYEKRKDCNIPENATWEAAISYVLNMYKEERGNGVEK